MQRSAAVLLPALVVALALMPASLAPAQTAEVPTFWDPGSHETVLSNVMATMTDEELLAQVFMLGWDSEYAEGPVMDWISTRNIGGIKVFGWNGISLDTLARTIGTMQSVAVATRLGIPLFTATDQEGGWVRHIKGTTSVTPGNMAIGATGMPYDAYQTGYYIGGELRALGINMNFAPTVDVYRNPEAHVIGPRAFGDDPYLTGLLGIAFFRGMEARRVIATAKHFPGHGNASGDSHGIMPILDDSYDVLWDTDLVPYRMMIPEGIPAVLSGHLSFPIAAAGDGRPASLSPFFKRTVLRDALGFDGIVITDDLYMGGAWEYGREHGWGIEEITLEALRAGNDMVMLSRTPALNDRIWTRALAEFRGVPSFRASIEASVRRILRVKLQYLQGDDRVPLQPQVDLISEFVNTAEERRFFFDQAARSVTIMRNRAGVLPFRPTPDQRVLLVSQDRDFFIEATARFPNATEFRFEYEPFYWSERQTRTMLRAVVDDYDVILFNLSNPNSLEVLQAIENTSATVIVFSILTPIYLLETPWVDTALAVYGWGAESFRTGFAALAGEIPARGRAPLSVLDGW